jgi:plasmid stabilization system protein ParE
MPQVYRVKYSAKAARQLEAISDYIFADSPQNAVVMLERLINAIESLDQLPHRYAVPRHVKKVSQNVRSMPVPPYLVQYPIDDRNFQVSILSVRHGARRPGR